MQKKRTKIAFSTLIALIVLLVGVFVVSPTFAAKHQATQKNSGGAFKLSATKGPSVASSAHTANLYSLPKAATHSAKTGRGKLPFLAIHPGKYAQAKAVAKHNKNAPTAKASLQASSASPAAARSKTAGFPGMADSATICPYFGGCQPPDMALATSPKYVLQGVNSSYAIYDTHGNLVVGPVNDQVWYGIPNPPGGCDPAGAFLSDPRAFYDPNTGLFWTATLQIEGALGVGSACPFQSVYWVANLNPKTGVMHVYSFDMALSTLNVADYTEFGFNKTTIAFSGNMFDSVAGTFSYAQVVFADKHAMELGAPVTAHAFTGFNVTTATSTILLDTIQPVETITPANMDPGVEYLVDSFNGADPFGNDCTFTACHGFVTWAYDLTSNTISGQLVFSQVPDPTYVVAPPADEPGNLIQIDTLDTRISATPVYSVGSGNGLISFALDTGVNNGNNVFPSAVPGVLWAEVQPSLSSTTLIGANLYQSGYINFSGDQAAFYGATMQDKSGRLVMVFDTSSANLNPSVMVTQRMKNDPLSNLRPPRFLVKGTASYVGNRWGDFSAASYDGFSSNHIWVAGEYSIGDWATWIARV
ncbi:MAG: hypothetical protein H0W02_24540 [Ktedonobacteraceae bacterium]|nr:hypothetical protein [Ktedonobacteraceae bacterium]